ncbi:MAG: carboxypeptidase regulatory-like domain-containing protein [Pseudomonadales bacterium]|jgi:hypothetical protein|tara:strand:- start:26868 stop:30017 length:3150 start_codon:yes stop_codon:yes gene_type:complete
MFRKLTAGIALLLLAAVSIADTDTTATMRGSVNVNGAEVTVVNEGNGLKRSKSLGDDQNFSFSFLPVGGPYTISVSAPGYAPSVVSEVYLAIYQNDKISINLLKQGSMEEVVVKGQKLVSGQGFGTGTTLDRQGIDGIPTVERSIADYARMDPRVNINAESSRALEISAMGANNRFNDFQIDGVSFNDPFGLNANGFGTMRNPISMDFVEQISVDITPFDVSRGSATGASISVVTKSGSNEFDGSLYITKRDENGVGEQPGGGDFPPFEEDILAFTLSGPIIEDKLFFFFGYEEFERTEPFGYGPKGSGALNESEAATADVFDQIASIANSRYGFDPGSYENLSFPESHEEYTVKLDYYVTDQHRLELNYSNSEDLLYQGIGGNKFSKTVYSKPPEIERLSFTYYGELTDQLSVKAKYTSYEMTEDDGSAGNLFPEVSITYRDDDGNQDYIVLGGEKYRGANFIAVDTQTFSLKADYALNAHLITAGVEMEESNIQNTFLARYNGEVRFDSIDDFESGEWSYLRFQIPTAGLTALDTITANFDVDKTSFYLQDIWNVNDQLTLQAGVRWDKLQTPTKPVENTAFTAAYGYTNAQAFSYDIVQPRFSFEYDLASEFASGLVEAAVVRGGYGLFMGRFPNVWLGNAYSRPGPLSDYPRGDYRNDDGSISGFGEMIGLMPAGDPSFFWVNSPDSTYEIAAAGSNSASQYVDPDFEAPSSWRGNLALDLYLAGGYDVTLELNHDTVNEAIAIRDPGLTQNGQLADGRGIYATSNSLELTNVDEGGATAFTVSLRKSFFDRLNVLAAYTNTDAEDVWELTSTQAGSVYGYQPRWDGDNLDTTSSSFSIEHRFLVSMDYTANLFGNNDTRFSLVFNRSSGEPYSVTFDNRYGITGARGHYGGYDLAYIPTGADDAKVNFASADVATAVMAHVNATALSGFKGTYAPRNAFTGPWTSRLDLRITQEINFPEFLPQVGENKAIIYLDLINLGNLIDDDSGIVRAYRYNSSRQILTNGFDRETGRINITGVDEDDNLYTATGSGQSSWQMRLGFKYQF